MDAIVEARVKDYLRTRLHIRPYDCGTILECMRSLARMAGHEIDERFAQAGLGAGPEARVASRIVDYALLGGGTETPEDAFRTEINRWIRTNPLKGR